MPKSEFEESKIDGTIRGIGTGCLPLVACLLLQILFLGLLVPTRQLFLGKIVFQMAPFIAITLWVTVLIYAIVAIIRKKRLVFGIATLVILAGTLLLSPILIMDWVLISDALSH